MEAMEEIQLQVQGMPGALEEQATINKEVSAQMTVINLIIRKRDQEHFSSSRSRVRRNRKGTLI